MNMAMLKCATFGLPYSSLFRTSLAAFGKKENISAMGNQKLAKSRRNNLKTIYDRNT